MPDSTGWGVEMGQSSGISSSSCLGVRTAVAGSCSLKVVTGEVSSGSGAAGYCP